MNLRRCLFAAGMLPGLAFAQQPPVLNIDNEPSAGTARQPRHAHAGARAKQVAQQGLRARSIAIEGPWAQGADIGLKVCDPVTTDAIFSAMEALEAAITRSPAASAVLGSHAEAEILLIQVDYDTQPGTQGECGNGERTVGITFRPYHVRTSLGRLGDNVLPLPRSAMATLYANVPAPLRALDPRLGLSQDKAFGAAVSAAVGAEVPMADRGGAAAHDALALAAQTVRSTAGEFHCSEGSLAYLVKPKGSLVSEYRLGWSGVQNVEPLASSSQSHRATSLGAGATLKPRRGMRVFLDANWRRVTDEVTSASLVTEYADSRRLTGLAMMEALDASCAGFLRAAQ